MYFYHLKNLVLQQTLLSSHRQKPFLAVSAESPVLFSVTLFPSLSHLPLHKTAEEPNGLLCLRIVRRRLDQGKEGAAGCVKKGPIFSPGFP